MNSSLSFALYLTVAAGLSTVVGALIFLTFKKFQAYSSYFFGMAAGAMIYVSLFDLLPPAIKHIGWLYSLIFLSLGSMSIAVINTILPIRKKKDCNQCKKKYNAYFSTGLITFIGIALHNFPEGIAVFMSAVTDKNIGQLLAFATALHNLPEGVAIAAPILYGTKSKAIALGYSLVAGIAEPLGAVIAFLILQPYLSQQVIHSLFALISGIMIYISIDELLPLCLSKGCTKTALVGIASGISLIALSLFLM